jgi:hypothetical protein
MNVLHRTAAAALVVCAMLAGCGATEHGGVDGHTTTASVAVKTKYDNPEVAACMQRNGITILSNGRLQVSKAVIAAKRKAVEKRCGFGVPKDTRRSGNVTKKRLVMEKPPPRKSRAKGSQTQRPQLALTRDGLVAKVVVCLHKEGVAIPPSDSALLSSTSGIKTRSRRIRAAISKCRSEL